MIWCDILAGCHRWRDPPGLPNTDGSSRSHCGLPRPVSVSLPSRALNTDPLVFTQLTAISVVSPSKMAAWPRSSIKITCIKVLHVVFMLLLQKLVINQNESLPVSKWPLGHSGPLCKTCMHHIWLHAQSDIWVLLVFEESTLAFFSNTENTFLATHSNVQCCESPSVWCYAWLSHAFSNVCSSAFVCVFLGCTRN